MTTNRLRRDQSGLVGKIAVVWLLILAVVVVAGFDAVAIGITKYRVEDIAGNAASEAATTYKNSGKVADACQAAVDLVAKQDADAKIPTSGCAIDPKTGVATITVRKIASTLVAQRLSITRDLTHLQSTESVNPPI
jgi:hypothetical protein